ncbi:MAG: DnaJ domain-containing protein [Cyanobacteria bacterium P01_G01_bin.39]
MSFAIKHGLFKLNITDHHAILGVSIDADPKQIRLQYLKIAQKLHPDKCRSDLEYKKRAGQLLSKLVNPAYEQLSRKTAFAEHQLVLIQIGKRLAENQEKVTVKNELAQELLQAGTSAELVYPKLLKKLTTELYSNYEQIGQKIESISELNLVYLMLKGNRGVNRNLNQNSVTKPSPEPTMAQDKAKVNKADTAAASTPVQTEEPTTESRVASFVKRAQKYISRAEFDRALKELKDALRIDPNNGVAHAVMGRVYLHKNQLTMAKVHISKACTADPHNQLVIDSKKSLDKLTRVSNRSKASNPGSAANKNAKSGNNSFLSGFFGSKKK